MKEQSDSPAPARRETPASGQMHERQALDSVGGMIAQAVERHRRQAARPDVGPVPPADARVTPIERGSSSLPVGRPAITAPGAPHNAAMPSERPVLGFVLAGVALPVAAIGIEAVNGTLARSVFDPIPTAAHLVILAVVPFANLVAILAYMRSSVRPSALAFFLLGIATAVAALYALMFLPLLPIAVVALIAGVGLLPLSPHIALAASIALHGRLVAMAGAGHRPYALGILGGVVALAAIEAPVGITRHGFHMALSSDPAERQRGIGFLRTWGSRDVLLAWSNGVRVQPIGLLSLGFDVFSGRAPARRVMPTERAREIYWQVTGEPFNSKSVPLSGVGLRDTRQFDADLGGQRMGGRVPGLALVESRLDGTIAPADAVSYVEWLFEIENTSTALQEARMTLLLPPGGVVSRVTLWVNGVEEEAAYAGRGQVRAAYERVVRRAQDPFLVTTKGADRVLAQAFPVPANGGRMRFKVGITAPVELETLGQGRLVLPAIVERNFDLAASGHNVWIESKGALTGSKELAATPLEGGGARVAGTVSDWNLTRNRPAILVTRAAEPRVADGGSAETGFARQIIAAGPAMRDRVLMLVLDGSAAVAGYRAAIHAAFARSDAVADGAMVGLALADGSGAVIAPAPWTGEQRSRVLALVEAARMAGGADNTPALAAAIALTADREGARVLWLHGPQPVEITGARAALEQAIARVRRLPELSLLALEPGVVATLPDVPWAWAATALAETGGTEAALVRVLARETGRTPIPAITRHVLAGPSVDQSATESASTSPLVAMAGSPHIARLAARTEVLDIMRRDPIHGRAAAIEIASRHRLVTPVSGAVVLETQRQYVEAGLTQTTATKGAVPTVPEPETLALLGVVLAVLGWLILGRRQWLRVVGSVR